jgi:hypothetical protein
MKRTMTRSVNIVKNGKNNPKHDRYDRTDNKNSLDNKGQIAGQIFIYIMAAVVIGAIVLIGYKAIVTIPEKVCQAERATFKSDIEGLIEKYTSDGSVNPKTMRAPCDYDTICFVDATTVGDATALSQCDYPIIRDSKENNIFVISNKRVIPVGFSDLVSLSDTIKTQEGCLCIKQRNKNFYITFSGRGATTEISGS